MMQTTWLSVHIFYDGGLNHVLRQLVIPFLEEAQPSSYFFIRYGEGGPHIRLRLHDSAPVIEKYQHPFTIQYVPYIPEISRYGNEHTIHLAEQHFHLSSAYVLSQLSDDQSAVFLQAIRLNLTMLYNLPDALRICSDFVQSWLPDVSYLPLFEEKFNRYAGILLPASEQLCRELAAGKAEARLQQYADVQAGIMDSYYQSAERNKMCSIVRSLLHMQHNRLGIRNRDESYIMYLTQKCLEHVAPGNSCV